MKTKKRGQVTIYIILGIVIVASFLTILFLVNSVTTNKLSSEQRRMVSAALESSSINFYAQTCLRDALEEGLILAGKQGGVIYKEQGGSVERAEGRAVQFNEDWVDLAVETKLPVTPEFPCTPGGTLAPDYCRYELDQVVFLGNPSFPPLSAVQEGLEDFIASEVQECVGELLENQDLSQGLGIELEEKPEVRVVFGQRATLAKMDYPLNVTAGTGQSLRQFLYWNARADVRFREIYNMAQDMIQDDNNYVRFNLSSSPGSDVYDESAYEPNLFYGEGVLLEEDRRSDSDIFILNDSLSTIEGRPYVFRFARQNRQPALGYISSDPTELYDYLTIQGEQIEIEMEARDPDEDLLSYYFFGENALLSGEHQSQRWSKETNNIEPGLYRITAEIEDGTYNDSQTVRILVDEKVVVSFTVSGVYGMLSLEDPMYVNASGVTRSLDPNTVYYYQWELPFANRSKRECLILPGLVNCSAVNVFQDYGDFEIREINETMPPALFLGSAGKSFKLNVTAVYNEATNRSQSDVLFKTLQIPKCVEHTNGLHPFPYPYHNHAPNGSRYGNEINPFLAAHACCDNGEYANGSVVCFEKEGAVYTDNGVELNKTVRQFCSGDRGNICNGRYEEEIKCGKQNVPSLCQGQGNYSLVSNGWCYGEGGCEKVCQSPNLIIDIDDDGILDSSDRCGRCSSFGGYDCDSDFDGTFEGICISSSCVPT